MTSHSPQQRLQHYRQERQERSVRRLMHVAALFCFWAYSFYLIQLDPTRRGILASALLPPIMLVTGDLYSVVRDFLEQRMYCPRYDKASQPRPQFVVLETIPVMYVRFWMYAVIVPIPPTAMFWLLNFCGQWQLHYAFTYGLAFVTSLLYGTLRVMNWPVTASAWLRPFKKVPSPDLN